MVEVKASGPPHDLGLVGLPVWLTVGLEMLPAKYFHTINASFVSVEFHGNNMTHRFEVNQATIDSWDITLMACLSVVSNFEVVFVYTLIFGICENFGNNQRKSIFLLAQAKTVSKELHLCIQILIIYTHRCLHDWHDVLLKDA